MRKQALGLLMGLAVLGWLAGCSQQAATTPAAQPTAPKPAAQEAPQKPAEAQAEAAKPAEQPSAPQAEAPAGAAATIVAANGMTFRIVYFDFDKYNIKPEYQEAIKYNASLLKKSPQARVTVEGHCDERGTTEYNLALGERRATAVRNAMEAEGVEKGRMKVVSYGEERPVDPGHTEEAWAKNRRSVLE